MPLKLKEKITEPKFKAFKAGNKGRGKLLSEKKDTTIIEIAKVKNKPLGFFLINSKCVLKVVGLEKQYIKDRNEERRDIFIVGVNYTITKIREEYKDEE